MTSMPSSRTAKTSPTGRARPRRRATATPAAAGKREDILGVATKAFAASGFDGVRLHEIARAARMNQATLVYYFASKRALYEACLSDAAAQLMEAFAEGTRAADGRSAADTIVGALLNRFARKPELGRLIRQATLRGGVEFERSFVRPLRPWFERGVVALERAMDEGLIARQDAEELVLILYGAILIYLSEDPLVTGLTGKDPRAPRNLKRHQSFVLESAARLLDLGRGGP
jgi:TetR/AcrR family transcriptional regulator